MSSKEKETMKFKVPEGEGEKEELTPLMEKYEEETDKNAKWGGELTEGYKEWRKKRKKEDSGGEAEEKGSDRIKVKIKDQDAPSLKKRSVSDEMAEVRSQLQKMNAKQKRIEELEELYDEEEDKRIAAESKLEALEPELEEAKSELKRLRKVEKEHEKLKREYEELENERNELQAMHSREDLKNLKEALWAADKHLEKLERDNKEGKISDKKYQAKREHLLKEKWDVQHKMLILKDWLEEAVEKTEMVEEAGEEPVEGVELKEKEGEERELTPLMEKYEEETDKHAKWGGELTEGYKEWREEREKEEKSKEKKTEEEAEKEKEKKPVSA